MARKFNELRDKLAQEVGEARLSANSAQVAAEYDTQQARLADVRRALNLTQVQLAQNLEMTQSQVSRIENQSDMFLSTIASYLEAMGGHLELVGVFEGGVRVPIEIGDRTTAATVA